jgi:hypothetical protein
MLVTSLLVVTSILLASAFFYAWRALAMGTMFVAVLLAILVGLVF